MPQSDRAEDKGAMAPSPTALRLRDHEVVVAEPCTTANWAREAALLRKVEAERARLRERLAGSLGAQAVGPVEPGVVPLLVGIAAAAIGTAIIPEAVSVRADLWETAGSAAVVGFLVWLGDCVARREAQELGTPATSTAGPAWHRKALALFVVVGACLAWLMTVGATPTQRAVATVLGAALVAGAVLPLQARWARWTVQRHALDHQHRERQGLQDLVGDLDRRASLHRTRLTAAEEGAQPPTAWRPTASTGTGDALTDSLAVGTPVTLN